MVQHAIYHGEIADLKSSRKVKKGSELHSLYTFLDKNEIFGCVEDSRNSLCHMRISIRHPTFKASLHRTYSKSGT
jgi:hypothetical protein